MPVDATAAHHELYRWQLDALVHWLRCGRRGVVEAVTGSGNTAISGIIGNGGATSLADLEKVALLGRGRVDLTIGSALDIFGGTGVRYRDCVEFNQRLTAAGA